MTPDEFVNWVATWVLDGDVETLDGEPGTEYEYQLDNDEAFANYQTIVGEARRLARKETEVTTITISEDEYWIVSRAADDAWGELVGLDPTDPEYDHRETLALGLMGLRNTMGAALGARTSTGADDA